MKRLKTRMLALAMLGTAMTNGLAQGEIIFLNNAATTITNALTGSAWWGSESNLLRVAVYGANGANQPESSLVLQSTAITNLNAPGRFFGGIRVLNLPADLATLQVRAWGASTFYLTYEAAFAAGLGGDDSVVIGKSPSFSDVLGFPPGSITPLTFRLQPFSMHPVPEPSVWALGVLGAFVLLLPLLRRRRP